MVSPFFCKLYKLLDHSLSKRSDFSYTCLITFKNEGDRKMKRLLTGLIVCFLTASSFANTRIGIVEIEAPTAENEAFSAFASDGRIYNIEASNTELIENAYKAMEMREEIEVVLSDHIESEEVLELRNEILDIHFLSVDLDSKIAEQNIDTQKFLFDDAELENDYVTNFTDSYSQSNVFENQRRDTKSKSQCYNRAHVWSYEMRRFTEAGRRVQPGKIWLFFTRRYIRNYNYKWWFHIAPYTKLNGEVKVMDRSYSRGPEGLQYWTNRFVASNQRCPIVSKYSQYRNYQNSSDCYVIKTSVHYWQPWQIENAENKNQAQTGWNNYELKKAYQNAIGRFTRPPQL